VECSSSQVVGQTHHMLISVRGGQWREIELVMFTLYIDDSGTDPNQHVAIATALIIPAAQIIPLEREWNTLREKHGFTEFHTSIFVARNRKSEFKDWSEDQQKKLFARVRQISRKYGVRAASIAVNKKDYDEIVPPHFRNYIGKYHYTWAIRQLVSFVSQGGPYKAPSREWVFQWMERGDEARIEVETVMEQAQWLTERDGMPGDYSNYTFRKSAGIPGLQCVDAIGWMCYRYALYLFNKTPAHPFALEGWYDLHGHLGEDGWLVAITLLREKLQKSITKALGDGRAVQFFKEWEERKRNQNEKKI
jgi:hypothetical protein